MLKARGNRELDVLGGRPIHISGQVSQISDHEFEKKMFSVLAFLQSLNLPCILFPPFPRHFSRCCVNMNHFDRDFSGEEFVKDVRDWGTYMAMSHALHPRNCQEIFIPFLPAIFGEGMFRDGFTGDDGVHLRAPFKNLFHDAAAEIIRSVCSRISPPYVVPASIPSEVSLMAWNWPSDQNLQIIVLRLLLLTRS